MNKNELTKLFNSTLDIDDKLSKLEILTNETAPQLMPMLQTIRFLTQDLGYQITELQQFLDGKIPNPEDCSIKFEDVYPSLNDILKGSKTDANQ